MQKAEASTQTPVATVLPNALSSPPAAGSSSLAPPAPGFDVTNSQSATVKIVDGVTVHPVPALDGLGLMLVSVLLGVAALWIWRRQ